MSGDAVVVFGNALGAAMLLALLACCGVAGVWLLRRSVLLLTRRPRVVTLAKPRDLTRRM